jgi:hypothetical protein
MLLLEALRKLWTTATPAWTQHRDDKKPPEHATILIGPTMTIFSPDQKMSPLLRNRH